jgi:hypothetical protein
VTVQKSSLWMWISIPAALHVLVLVVAHPKLWIFVRLCAWSILSLGPKAPLAHHPAFIVCLCDNFDQIVVPQVKKLSLFVTAFKDLYMFQDHKIPIVIPQAPYQALGTCFHVRFLWFIPQLCDYSRSPSTCDLQFSSASQLEVSTRK